MERCEHEKIAWESEGKTAAVSPMQEGMIFHRIHDPEGGVDIEQVVGRLSEWLHLPELERAWEEVARKRPILRAALKARGGPDAYWEVEEVPRVPIEERDLSSLPPEEKEARLQEFLRDDRRKGFELDQAPFFRVTVFRFGEKETRLIWTFWHALLDGRSISIVLREVMNRYDALVGGGEGAGSGEEEPDEAFINHLQWLQRTEPAKAEDYWRARLEGFRAPTPLPGIGTEQAGHEQPGGETGEVKASLSEGLTGRLHALAKAHGITVNTLCQGAWALILHAYSGDHDIVFGAVRACRRSSGVAETDSAVGMFINTLPIRVSVPQESNVIDWLKAIRQEQLAVREYEQIPLVTIQQWSEVASSEPLFESILVYDHVGLNESLRAEEGRWEGREFELHERPPYPLALYAHGGERLGLKLLYDARRLDPSIMERVLDNLAHTLETIASHPERPVGAIEVVSPREKKSLMSDWQGTSRPLTARLTIPDLFETRAHQAPEATALVYEEAEWSFRRLNEKANQMARYLRREGVERESLVGVCLDRSDKMVVCLLAILKAGAAYLPLDPTYPRDRLSFIIEDSASRILLTERKWEAQVSGGTGKVRCVEDIWSAIESEETLDIDRATGDETLAYVIYTSGSTGKPKGVMVTHRNAVNFFLGMDERLGTDPGVWLAVTSISFDISVLELFWTLTRGYKVVLASDHAITSEGEQAARASVRRSTDFSLFYFASESGAERSEKYRLLFEGAKFADQNGFKAIWTPERHFHGFGGLYPNPSVTSAALASITRRIEIRAGSVVMPLHNPIRVAEEWSLVDNLSQGRVGLSVASGWQPSDFVLMPQNYADRKQRMFEGVDLVRRLWRGEEVQMEGVEGKPVSVRLYPPSVQGELPLWVTAAGNPETFRVAGEIGANVLTHLLGQRLEDVGEKIRIYREAWREAGHSGWGTVTLMLHTFLGSDRETVREKIRGPFCEYLKTSVDLIRNAPFAFPTFSPPTESVAEKVKNGMKEFSDEEMDYLLGFAFERYFENSGLFGTPEAAQSVVDSAKGIGVDEIACLIDFGVDVDSVLNGLEHLKDLKDQNRQGDHSEGSDRSFSGLIRRHGVTHLQCTPSFAQMIVSHPGAGRSLKGIRTLLLGGEPLPQSLVKELRDRFDGAIHNMYGPTETTVWSSSFLIPPDDSTITIGQPIVNTTMYILDDNGRVKPIGAAGELYIGGEGVTRGYWNRSELTNEKFVPDPFSSASDSRMYRTGDLACFRPDGNIQFVGRRDSQIKIRGHRIELGEIEATLEEHPEVRQAVVVARGDERGDRRLVAFVVAQGHGDPTPQKLRSHAESRLPDFMIPSFYATLSEMPLTPNGKIDRRQLPEWSGDREEKEEEFVAPQAPIELKLAEIWGETLGVRSVGLKDNFFRMGGHSLLAVHIAFRIREVFNVDVPLQSFLQDPTIEGLAACVEQRLMTDVNEQDLIGVLEEVEQLRS